MNTLRFARHQIASSFVTIGVGVVLLYVPAILGFFFLGKWAPLLWILLVPVGFYVIGRGVAGVIEGSARIVHAINDEKRRGD